MRVAKTIPYPFYTWGIQKVKAICPKSHELVAKWEHQSWSYDSLVQYHHATNAQGERATKWIVFFTLSKGAGTQSLILYMRFEVIIWARETIFWFIVPWAHARSPYIWVIMFPCETAAILPGVLEYFQRSCEKWRVRGCSSIEDTEWLISFSPPPHTHFKLIHHISGKYNTWNNKNKSLYIKFLVGELCR